MACQYVSFEFNHERGSKYATKSCSTTLADNGNLELTWVEFSKLVDVATVLGDNVVVTIYRMASGDPDSHTSTDDKPDTGFSISCTNIQCHQDEYLQDYRNAPALCAYSSKPELSRRFVKSFATSTIRRRLPCVVDTMSGF